MIALRQGESGPLAWNNLIRESVGIVVFIAVWYLLGWTVIGFGVGFASGGGAGVTLIGAAIAAIGLVMVVASTFIVLLRILGKAIAFGLEEANANGALGDSVEETANRDTRGTGAGD